MSDSELRTIVAAILLNGYIQSNMTEAYNHGEGLETLVQYSILATDTLLMELDRVDYPAITKTSKE